jgi:hypothetical protein
MLFSTLAKGRSAAEQTVNVTADMSEIVFKLKAGSVIRGHVQDESGQAIAGVSVYLAGSPGEPSYDAYEFNGTTDGQGNFNWDGAPDEPMKFGFSKDGYESTRDTTLKPNEDNTITLRQSRQLHGQVLDETTGQAVTNFTVRTGKASDDGENVYGVIRYQDFTSLDGTFTMSIREEDVDAVAVYAPGYSDKIEKLPDAQNGVVQVTIQLKPSAGLSGTVVGTDGAPAAGVNVAVASEKPRSNVGLTGGRLRSYDSSNKMATTDENGHFTIPTVPEDGTLIAAGDQGFASVPLAQVQNNGTVTLQAWGRIEGTLKIGGQPGVGKDLLFNFKTPGVWTDFNGYKATTDDQGHFTMEKIPPGDGAIVRLVQTAPNTWTHSDSTTVTVKAGETTQVTIGDNGAVLTGRFHLSFTPTNTTPLFFQGNLNTKFQMPTFNNAEDAHAYYQSPEYKAFIKTMKNYAIELKPDGSFTVDDVSPGDYSLNISGRVGIHDYSHPPVAQGGTIVTVPDSFDPATPIDIGDIQLDAPSPPQMTQ